MPARTALDGTPCWIDLTSSDTEVAKSFYTNVFGWQADTNDDPQYGGYAIFSKPLKLLETQFLHLLNGNTRRAFSQAAERRTKPGTDSWRELP